MRVSRSHDDLSSGSARELAAGRNFLYETGIGTSCRLRSCAASGSSVRALGVVVGLALGFALQTSRPVFAQASNQPPDTMAARVEACTPCHGNKGEGTSDVYFPRLAGKPAGYLYNQLLAFKNGRRKYPPMNYLLEYLSDQYLQDMAEYFAEQRPPLPAAAAGDVSAQVLQQ